MPAVGGRGQIGGQVCELQRQLAAAGFTHVDIRQGGPARWSSQVGV